MPPKNLELLRASLDRDLKLFYNNKQSLFDDPIHCIDPALSPADAEILSFIIAGLSYGRVEQIKKSSFDLLQRLTHIGTHLNGAGVSTVLRSSSEEQLAQSLHKALFDWKHRLNTRQDLVQLFLTLQKILSREKSLCTFFQKSHVPENPELGLIAFSKEFLLMSPAQNRLRKVRHSQWKGTGVSWFVPSPADKGTCKKLLMWLRWMVRKDAFDLGLWQHSSLKDLRLPAVLPSQLFVPVDTHLQKWALAKKITRLKSPSWKMTKDVSQFFRRICPDDPLKYDFMICHEGMRTFRSGAGVPLPSEEI